MQWHQEFSGLTVWSLATNIFQDSFFSLFLLKPKPLIDFCTWQSPLPWGWPSMDVGAEG